MKLTKLFFLLALASMITFSCEPLDDIENIETARFDAEYAVPIFNTQLSLRETLESFEDLNTIYVDENGLIHFQYSGDLLTQNSNDIFESINDKISGIPIPLTSNNTPIPLGDDTGLEFDRLEFKSGGFAWGIEHSFEQAAEVTLTLPQITKDGAPLSFSRTLGAAENGGTSQYNTLLLPAELAGYVVDADPETGEIYAEYEFTLADGTPETPNFIAITFLDLTFNYMEGYMGVEEHKGTDTIEIDFFDSYVRGDIYFADPTVTFKVENTFGIPTRSRVNEFEVYTVDGETLQLTGEFIDNGIDFPYPELNEVGEIAYGSFEFNKDNSNIAEILGSGPLAIYYDVDAITNPDENTDIRGFITDSSYYDVRVEVDLPLYGTSTDFIGRDTFEIEFNNFDDVDNAEFKLVAENELPLEVLIQGYFVDERGVVLDSLFEERQLLIASAKVDEEGNAMGATEQVTFIDFQNDRFQKIQPTKNVRVVASFYTANEGQQSVYILDRQSLGLRMGAIFGVNKN
jgi:hypothetical protein